MKKTLPFLTPLILFLLIPNILSAQSLCNQIQIAKDDQLNLPCTATSFTLASLLANDTENLELASHSQPENGSLVYDRTTEKFTFTPAQGFSGTFKFTYTLKRIQEDRLGAPLIVNGVEHYYEQIQVNPYLSWNDAKVLAESKSYNGKKGYLATVTSATENEFIHNKLVNASLGARTWLGATDSEDASTLEVDEGTWRWATGPEAGTRLTSLYNNWASGEPNNVGDEDYLMMDIYGKWNDLSLGGNPDAGYAVNMIFVEYGSDENCDAGLTATASIQISSMPSPDIEFITSPYAYTSATGQNFLILGQSLILKPSGGTAGTTYTFGSEPNMVDNQNGTFSFTPTSSGTYNLLLTATNVSCVATKSFSINVIDAGCGRNNDKVLVCHSGNLLCVSAADVANHIAHGDIIGTCGGKTGPANSLNTETTLQAYPNPLSTETTLAYSLSQDDKCRIEVTDLNGLVVSVIDGGFCKAGQLKTTLLNADKLVNGFYVVRLVSSKEVKNLRLEVIK